jgi:hypothetical protein
LLPPVEVSERCDDETRQVVLESIDALGKPVQTLDEHSVPFGNDLHLGPKILRQHQKVTTHLGTIFKSPSFPFFSRDQRCDASVEFLLYRDTVKADVGRIEALLDGDESSVRRLEATIEGDKSSVRRLETTLDGDELSVERPETALNGDESSVRRLETTFHRNESPVRRVETALDGDESSVHRFDAAIDGAEPTIDPYKMWPHVAG